MLKQKKRPGLKAENDLVKFGNTIMSPVKEEKKIQAEAKFEAERQKFILKVKRDEDIIKEAINRAENIVNLDAEAKELKPKKARIKKAIAGITGLGVIGGITGLGVLASMINTTDQNTLQNILH